MSKKGKRGGAYGAKPAYPKPESGTSVTPQSKSSDTSRNDARLIALRESIKREREYSKEENAKHKAKMQERRDKIKAMQERLLKEELKILNKKQQALKNKLQLSRSSGSSRAPSSSRQPQQDSSSREESSARPESSGSSSNRSSFGQDMTKPEPDESSLPASAPTRALTNSVGTSKPQAVTPKRPNNPQQHKPSIKVNREDNASVVKNEKAFKRDVSDNRSEDQQAKREVADTKREILKPEPMEKHVKERSSSPEIIMEKRAKNKRPSGGPPKFVAQPAEVIDYLPKIPEGDDRFPGKTFIPVTEEVLPKILKIVKRFEEQQRCVAIVFSACFYVDDIDFNIVLEKFEPIFGHLEPEQIFVRVENYCGRKLTRTPEEAYKQGFKTLNQAYIISESKLTVNDLNRKAAALQVFICPMSLGCIRNNLKQGLYLMHRSLVLGSKSPQTAQPVKEVSDKPEENTAAKKQPALTSEESGTGRAKKNYRILSAKENVKPKNTQEPSHTPKAVPAENPPPTAIVDGQLWSDISKSGGTVLKIENMPPNTTVNSFNLMMGTCSLKGHQMTAIKRPTEEGSEVMDIMIVAPSDNKDLYRILEKDGLKTGVGLKLRIERSHHGLLRAFMARNSSNLIKLETSDKLPIKWIGYGAQSQ